MTHSGARRDEVRHSPSPTPAAATTATSSTDDDDDHRDNQATAMHAAP